MYRKIHISLKSNADCNIQRYSLKKINMKNRNFGHHMLNLCWWEQNLTLLPLPWIPISMNNGIKSVSKSHICFTFGQARTERGGPQSTSGLLNHHWMPYRRHNFSVLWLLSLFSDFFLFKTLFKISLSWTKYLQILVCMGWRLELNPHRNRGPVVVQLETQCTYSD